MRESVKYISLALLIFIGLILLSSKIIKPNSNLVSPFPLSFLPASNLKLITEAVFEGFDGKYAVVVKNLKTGEGFKTQENEKFVAASLYKLWLMGVIYEKIAKGEFSLDDSVEGDVEEINKKFDLEGDDAELTEGHLQYSIESAIGQMITISHNYAALLLLSKFSNLEVEKFIEKLGLKNSKMSVPPKTTAEDIALFYERLYKGEVINPEYSQKMLEVLKKQELNDRLAKKLPKEISFAHKTGNLGLVENDAGIVFSPSGDFIIVVLTESKTDPLLARAKMSQLAKAVYEYFNK